MTDADRGTGRTELDMTPTLVRSDVLEDDSLGGRDFCTAYSDLLDRWLTEVFDHVADGYGGVALVAVGGQGRREMAPQSDLDLLLLTDGSPDAATVAERLWYPIWDSGLKLGHAVRTVRDTLALASDDLDTATALLSARHLAGDGRRSAELIERARSNWRRHGRRRIEQLLADVEERHDAHGSVAFDLEPDLKDAAGGLRDLHALSWARAAGAPVGAEVLAGLAAPYEVLLGARVELHRVQGRPGDRLVLQEQDAVAARTGDADADELMARVAEAGREIAFACEDIWYDLRIAGGTLFGRRLRDRSVDGELSIASGRVHLTDEEHPPSDPFLVLRVADLAAAERLRIAEATLSRLDGAPLPSEPWPTAARDRFCALLLRGHGAVEVVETLDRWGLWERLVPEWPVTRSRPQRNAYHRFTVDRHLLETVAEAAASAPLVPRPDLLVVAALLHDLGKAHAESGDHSEVGAALARVQAVRMGFDAADVETVEALVRHHLLLAEVATRRDIDDPATVALVADRIGDVGRVAMLRALTEADSLATGPSAWSAWKAQLVDGLAQRCSVLLGDGSVALHDRAFPTEEHRRLLQDGASASGPVRVLPEGSSVTVVCPDRPGVFFRVAGVLALHGLDVVGADVHTEGRMALDRFEVRSGPAGVIPWERVAADVVKVLEGRLALQARMDELARNQRRRHRAAPHHLAPQVRFDNSGTTLGTVVEVVGPDSTGLLYRLARSISEFDLNVTGARIDTVGPDAVDAFFVTDEHGRPVLDEEVQSEIRRALLNALEPAA